MDDFARQAETRHESFDEPTGLHVPGVPHVENPQASEPMDEANGARILATLESWRQNIGSPVI